MSETIIESRLIGELFVERGLVTEAELEQALELQAAQGGKLGEILVAEFGVSRVELASALAQQWAEAERGARAEVGDDQPEPAVPAEDIVPTVQPLRRPLGEIFVERGLVTEAELEAALETQRQSGAKLGEILVAQGVLSRLDLAGALADQWAGLQKLRPPDPKPIEPWQQAAPRELVESHGQPTTPAPANGLAAAVEALEQRVQAAEAAASPDRWREGVRVAADALTARIAAIEARLDGLAAGDERAAIDAIRASVIELRERLDGPDERLDALEQRLEETVTAAMLDERVPSDVAELGARLDVLAGRLDAPDRVEDVREALGRLEQRLDQLPPASDELRWGIGAVEERLDGLERRVTDRESHLDESLSATRDEVSRLAAEIRDRLASLEQQLGPLTVAEETGASAAVEGIAARLDALAADAARASDVDALRAELDTVRRQAMDAVDVESAGAPPELESRLSALAARIEQVAVAVPSVDEVAARMHGFAERLDVLAADAARGEDVESLRAEIAAIRDSVSADRDAAPALEALATRVDALQGRVDDGVSRAELTALAADLGLRLDEASSRIDDGSPDQSAIVGRLDELEARLRESSSGADVEALRDELRSLSERIHSGVVQDVEATARRLEDLARTVDEAIRVSANAHRPATDETSPRAESAHRRLDVLEGEAVRTGDVDPLRARLEGLESAIADEHGTTRARQDALEWRLGEIAARSDGEAGRLAALASELEALRATVAERPAELPRLSERIEEIAARVDEAASRVELTALAGDVRARLDALSRDLQSQVTDGLGSLQALAVRVDELHAATVAGDEWRGRMEEGIGQRLDQLGSRVDAADAAVSQVRGESEAQANEVSALRAEVAVGLDDLGRSLHGRLTGLERRADETDRVNAASAAGVHEELRRVSDRVVEVEAGLAHRLDGLVERVESETHAIAALREQADARAQWIGELETGIAVGLDELGRALRGELAQLERALDESTAANRQAIADGLERVAGSLTWRLEQVERALADGELAARLDAVEQRVDDGAAISDEHVRVTERALRKGLAALGERIAEAEGAYVESGNALRRSIERLGFAIAEADVRIDERDDPVAVEQHLTTATAHVAFAPTDEGYRLVALDGPPPAIGDEVELAERRLVCTRIGTSPLPLDARPCVYLEPLV